MPALRARHTRSTDLEEAAKPRWRAGTRCAGSPEQGKQEAMAGLAARASRGAAPAPRASGSGSAAAEGRAAGKMRAQGKSSQAAPQPPVGGEGWYGYTVRSRNAATAGRHGGHSSHCLSALVPVSSSTKMGAPVPPKESPAAPTLGAALLLSGTRSDRFT